MVKLITATECKGPSAFPSHPPSTPCLFFFFGFCSPRFFAYIIFEMENDNAASKLTLEIYYVLYSR